MNRIIFPEDVDNVIQSFMDMSGRDEVIETTILAIGAELLDISIDKMIERITPLSDDYFEVVEICPHCLQENVYPMWDTEVNGFVAPCKGCGAEILLCDECQHTVCKDGEVHDCDWCETKSGGKCHRGETKN